ncbi:MAG TPA: BON domain-containing protein [Thermoanaerobaculia bacterium]|nr:BON domain-containing protein [Thermoanaerobaculia bacterium]
MKTKTFPLALALWLVLTGGLLTGCDRDGREAVDAERDAQGNTEIHIDGDEVERELDQAGERVERGLDQAGEQLEQAGDQVAKGAEQFAEGAEQVGAAIERGAAQVEKQVGPILDDASITARVKAKLIADPEINSFHIDVDTVDGRVALNGKVSSAEQRAEAEDLARGTQGVRQVVNLIQIAGQDVPLQVPPAGSSQ